MNSNFFGFPDYCVFTEKDVPTKDEGITYLNIEKADVRIIKNLLELEGTTISERDILFLTTTRFKDLVLDSPVSHKELEEVFAMRRALTFLLENYMRPIDEEVIHTYNYLVNIDPKKRLSGRLRETNVFIRGEAYAPPDFRDLPRLFRNMFSAVDSIEGHINKAFSYLLAISKSQFFIDGNKRTARLVALHELAYGGQRMISPDLDTEKYLKLMSIFYETGEKEDFVKFLSSNMYSLYED